MNDQPVAGSSRSVRAARSRDDRCYVRCAGEGEQVVVAFPYDPALVGEAKAISGRHFDWDIKANVFPFDRLPQVVAFADTHGIEVAPNVRSLVLSAATGMRPETAASFAQAAREAAHLYLRHGLLPVPAWAGGNHGACRCSRGVACARPGKHPRSVHVGPGPHDYSWKPLACSTHEEVERRFASDGKYAGANLMLAIPDGMLVIDQDNDDGGRQAVAVLAERLGELPATLSHGTPHGMHRIYRTPAGWTTRAWVGKDTRNPLPAGLDLRVPGQILMAPPSRVPCGAELANYGPVTSIAVADLPAAYISTWTPPKARARAAPAPVPIPAGRVGAVSYVHARLTGITEDLAACKPGGRNTAIYTAALKVGSTLGAARSTPGAEHAAAAWTDESAEFALMAAAEQNGYIADHSAAAARATIRSGLRNGLRGPRPLPDFGRTSGSAWLGPHAEQRIGASRMTLPASPGRDPAASHDKDALRSARSSGVSSPESAIRPVPESTDAESGEREDLAARERRRAGVSDLRPAIVQKENEESRRTWQRDIVATGPTGSAIAPERASSRSLDWRDTVIRRQGREWQPQVTQPDPAVHTAEAAE